MCLLIPGNRSFTRLLILTIPCLVDGPFAAVLMFTGGDCERVLGLTRGRDEPRGPEVWTEQARTRLLSGTCFEMNVVRLRTS